MKLNRKLVLILSLVLSLALATGGTLAYLSDTDADVNTMTLGNVYITQNEQQRDENGNLEAFENNKPAYPAVGPIAWDETTVTFGDSEFHVFTDDLKNVVDKFVTVTNTGKSDAYVRTIVAIEAPDYDPNNLIHVNVNNTNGVSDIGWAPVDLGDVKYVYNVYTYAEALAPQETSLPSLMQLFLDADATNEDVAKFGDTWEVLVLSQAVQTAGFNDAKTALDTAFGEVSQENVAKWMGEGEDSQMDIGTPGEDWPNNNPPIIPEGTKVVTNLEELKNAFAEKETSIYVEEGTYAFGGNYSIPAGTTIFGMGEDVNFTGTLTSTLKDVTIENVKFGGSNTLRWAYPSGTVTFKNCEFTPTGVYAVHFDQTNGDVTFEDCTINGWAAMGSGSGHLTFKNCNVNGDGRYGVLRCFVDADVIDCTFDVDNVNKDDVFQDGLHAVGCTIEVKNCTNVNGTMEDLANVSDGGVINIQ